MFKTSVCSYRTFILLFVKKLGFLYRIPPNAYWCLSSSWQFKGIRKTYAGYHFSAFSLLLSVIYIAFECSLVFYISYLISFLFLTFEIIVLNKWIDLLLVFLFTKKSGNEVYANLITRYLLCWLIELFPLL